MLEEKMRETKNSKKSKNFFIRPEIFPAEKIRAFFTGRTPGIDREAVSRELDTSFSEKGLFMPVQKHTARVLVYEELTEDEIFKNPPEADAVITARPNTALGIMVADCVPVLLYDEKKGVTGAVHAGWRGTAQGILRNTIQKMASVFGSNPADIRIAIGPAIRKCCYEVDMGVLRQIEASVAANQPDNVPLYLVKGPKAYIDLPEANRRQAVACGAKPENIWVSEKCTSCDPGHFNSYRRESRLGAKAPGRQGGFIIRIS